MKNFEFDHTKESLTEALGVDRERASGLVAIGMLEGMTSGKTSKSLEAIVLSAKSIEEIAIASFTTAQTINEVINQ